MEEEKKITIKNPKTGNPLEITIRLAKENEISEIIEIEQICFPPSEAAKKEDFIERFKAFPENFVIAESKEEKKLIGFVNGCTYDEANLPDELYHNVKLHNKNGKYQTVFGLDVLPDYRRQGVAENLMKFLIELSKKRKKKGMILTCKDHLIHYYEKLGFKCQGVSQSTHGGAKWNDMFLTF